MKARLIALAVIVAALAGKYGTLGWSDGGI